MPKAHAENDLSNGFKSFPWNSWEINKTHKVVNTYVDSLHQLHAMWLKMESCFVCASSVVDKQSGFFSISGSNLSLPVIFISSFTCNTIVMCVSILHLYALH